MRILVCIKRAGILGDDVEFVDDDRQVDPDYLDFTLNEWDSYSVEEALRLRDAHGGDVVVVTVGEPAAEVELRRCLAMGADRAVRVNGHDSGVDPIAVAAALAEVARAEAPDLVLCGVQSGDSGQGAVGTALAGQLDLPVTAVVRKVECDPAARRAVVHRELEGGLVDVSETELPAVLTIQTGINEPRYVTMRAVLAVADAPIEVREPAADAPSGSRVRRMFVPETNRAVLLDGDPSEIARQILGIAARAGVR